MRRFRRWPDDREEDDQQSGDDGGRIQGEDRRSHTVKYPINKMLEGQKYLS